MPKNPPQSAAITASQPGFRLAEPDMRMERDVAEWTANGILLGQIERRLGWEIGDWWNRGERYADRVAIVSDPDWQGPSYKTCRNYGLVAARFDVSRRRDTLTFTHHAEVANLPTQDADRLLDEAVTRSEDSGEPPPSRRLRQAVKKELRDMRERELSEAARDQSQAVGHKLYPVVLADPPWRFDVWSQESGMDRAADNHYPTMALDDICNLVIPAADDAVLFLWRTAPYCEKAIQVMQAWGFDYRTELVWYKNRIGTGYWTRNQHEVLMIGVRGNPPAPAPGTQTSSVILADVARHSAKPEVFHEMIEAMFPHCDKLEMFSRQARAGWDGWGYEA